jgi:hypothetical protein
MGRPTVVTPEVLAKLEQAFGMGCSDKEACLYADISMDALYNHQNRNPHFAEWKAILKEKPVLKARNTVVTSLNDPENAKWYLERKTHGEFNARQALELTGSKMKKPPLIQPSPVCGFSENSVTRSPSITKPPKRAGGRTAVTVAAALGAARKISKASCSSPSPWPAPGTLNCCGACSGRWINGYHVSCRHALRG